ncbi:MAG: hypothetical protein WBV74_05735 [Pseudonocardiaceae bacterium]
MSDSSLTTANDLAIDVVPDSALEGVAQLAVATLNAPENQIILSTPT